MAAASPAFVEAEDLSDEQVQQLLGEAETRLRAAAGELKDVKSSEPEDLIRLSAVGDSDRKRKPLPKLTRTSLRATYIQEKDGIAQADPKALISDEQRKLAEQPRSVANPVASIKVNDQSFSGPEWFNMPKTVLDSQLKRDLQLIEMRSVLDPHRHYKKDNRKGKAPTFSQVGTVVEGPTEWYSSRINKKDRAKNFVEEAMTTEQETGRFKRKYGEIQSAKTSGKKTHYSLLMAKRKKRP